MALGPEDFFSLYGTDPASASATAQSIAQALRQRRSAGLAGIISGDPAMGATGKELAGSADQMQGALEQAAQHRAQQEMMRQHYENESQRWAALAGIQQQNANTRLAEAQQPSMGINPATGLPYVRKPGIGGRLLPKSTDAAPGGPITPTPSPSPPPGPAPQTPSPGPTAGGGGALPGLEPIPPAGKLRENYTKESAALQTDLDSAKASSRSAFGQSANVVFRGARNMALLNQKNPDGTQRQLTIPEWQEVAGGLIAMQTGGVPTQEMMRHGLPSDIKGDAASIMSWLTSSPQAPDRQAWIDRFVSNIQREEETSKTFQRNTQLQRLPGHSQFMGQYPNRAKQMISAYGLDPSLVDQINSNKYDVNAASKPPATAPASGGVQMVKTREEALALPKGTHFQPIKADGTPDGPVRVR